MPGLFITSSRIGDAIMTMSILAALRERDPQMTYVVAADPLVAPLFADDPSCVGILPFKKRRYSMHWIALWRACTGRRWDWIVDTRGSGLSFLLRHKWHAIWQSVKGDERSKIEQMCALVKAAPTCPRLVLSDDRRAKMKAYLPDAPTLVLAPVANWIGKQWPMERYIELVKRFLAAYPSAHILVLLAPAEEPQIAPFQDPGHNLPMDRITFSTDIARAAKTTLMDVIALMSHGTLFVGNDSGLMHVSYALPLPVVALFGPSRDHMYGPFPTDAHTVVRTPESYTGITQRSDYSPSAQINFMETLSVETVWEAVNKAFSECVNNSINNIK